MIYAHILSFVYFNLLLFGKVLDAGHNNISKPNKKVLQEKEIIQCYGCKYKKFYNIQTVNNLINHLSSKYHILYSYCSICKKNTGIEYFYAIKTLKDHLKIEHEKNDPRILKNFIGYDSEKLYKFILLVQEIIRKNSAIIDLRIYINRQIAIQEIIDECTKKESSIIKDYQDKIIGIIDDKNWGIDRGPSDPDLYRKRKKIDEKKRIVKKIASENIGNENLAPYKKIKIDVKHDELIVVENQSVEILRAIVDDL